MLSLDSGHSDRHTYSPVGHLPPVGLGCGAFNRSIERVPPSVANRNTNVQFPAVILSSVFADRSGPVRVENPSKQVAIKNSRQVLTGLEATLLSASPI
jgi:hypothetical protein